MTTVIASESSNFGGQPIEGYRFIGAFRDYLYTSAERDVSINGLNFIAIPIERTPIVTGTQENDNMVLNIDVPVDLDLVQDYAFRAQPPTLDLEIYRSHRDIDTATEFIIYWKGRVSNFTVNRQTCTIRSPSVLSLLLEGELPNRFYQQTCNHVLYDGRCKVSTAAHNETTTIITLSPRGMTVASVGARGNTYFTAGRAVLANGEQRMITKHVGTSIEFNFPFSTGANGDPVTLYGGCNLSYAGDCLTKFNNQINYGGNPFVPNDNPFSGVLD